MKQDKFGISVGLGYPESAEDQIAAIARVGAVSSGSDVIGALIAEAMEKVSQNGVITVENLNDNTNYTIFAVLRAEDGGTLSDPKKLTFTTPDDGVDNPITIDNVGYDSATFTINLPGNMLFQCIDKASLEYYGQSPESYIATAGIGILEKGPLTIEWYDGGNYGLYEMRMREDSE